MFETKIMCAYNQIERMTETHVYTIEVHEVILYYYQINYRPFNNGLWRKPAGHSCTMYETREAAEQAARRDSAWMGEGREWYITKKSKETFETKCHKYKRRR